MLRYAQWWLPILLYVLIAPFTPWLDMTIARAFFHEDHFIDTPTTYFLYNYAVIPADLALAISVIILIGSYFAKSWRKWREASLIMVLSMAIGAGLIVHMLFKDHWGRPRPKQVIEFGGIQEFRPFYKPNFFNQVEKSRSFPCGHCSMGFYFFALAVVGIQLRNRMLFWLGMVLAIVLGILLSWTRMAQGGHFLSDTLTTALIMWLVPLTFAWLYEKEEG